MKSPSAGRRESMTSAAAMTARPTTRLVLGPRSAMNLAEKPTIKTMMATVIGTNANPPSHAEKPSVCWR